MQKTKLRSAGSSPCVVPATSGGGQDTTELDQGVYYGSYNRNLWVCVSDSNYHLKSDKVPNVERRESTGSEKDFEKRYEFITHRLVHRRSCLEMYRRQISNNFGKLKKTIFPEY